MHLRRLSNQDPPALPPCLLLLCSRSRHPRCRVLGIVRLQNRPGLGAGRLARLASLAMTPMGGVALPRVGVSDCQFEHRECTNHVCFELRAGELDESGLIAAAAQWLIVEDSFVPGYGIGVFLLGGDEAAMRIAGGGSSSSSSSRAGLSDGHGCDGRE
ncbi:hypothetical protein GGR56DRAFT_571065 [Xylariaceae sp. FL0804]|nr:hypothetical protein GGR56DRAFT_571065 [Xylariaceae sp. FL0804]